MIRGLLLILDGVASWKTIARAERGFFFILLVHLLPLMALTLGVEAYALTQLGDGKTFSGDRIHISGECALRYAVAEAVLNLGAIVIGAKILQRINLSLRGVTSYLDCYRTLAYGLSPLFMAHLLDALPGINTWVCFAIGMVLTVAVLHNGVPLVIKPDVAKMLGIYVIATVVVLVMTGLAHFLSVTILHDELNFRFWEQFVR
jgi:hypothetical protein